MNKNSFPFLLSESAFLIQKTFTTTSIQRTVGVMVGFLVCTGALAGPQGEEVVNGVVTVIREGNTTTIDQTSTRAIITWDQFDVSVDETVQFNHQNTTDATLNRVTGGARSTINGNIQADGQVYIINDQGILIGDGAVINVGSFVATTSDLIDDDAFMDPSIESLEFRESGTASSGAIINNGTITIAEGGLAALVGPSVNNNGTITARLGRVALASTDRFTLDLNPASRDSLVTFAMDETLMSQLSAGAGVINSETGQILSDGGYIEISAQDVSQIINNSINLDGVIQANTVQQDLDGTLVLNNTGLINIGSGAESIELDGSVSANDDMQGLNQAFQGDTGGLISVDGRSLVVGENATFDTSADDEDGMTILTMQESVIVNGGNSIGGNLSIIAGNSEQNSLNFVNILGDLEIGGSLDIDVTNGWIALGQRQALRDDPSVISQIIAVDGITTNTSGFDENGLNFSTRVSSNLFTFGGDVLFMGDVILAPNTSTVTISADSDRVQTLSLPGFDLGFFEPMIVIGSVDPETGEGIAFTESFDPETGEPITTEERFEPLLDSEGNNVLHPVRGEGDLEAMVPLFIVPGGGAELTEVEHQLTISTLSENSPAGSVVFEGSVISKLPLSSDEIELLANPTDPNENPIISEQQLNLFPHTPLISNEEGNFDGIISSLTSEQNLIDINAGDVSFVAGFSSETYTVLDDASSGFIVPLNGNLQFVSLEACVNTMGDCTLEPPTVGRVSVLSEPGNTIGGNFAPGLAGDDTYSVSTNPLLFITSNSLNFGVDSVVGGLSFTSTDQSNLENAPTGSTVTQTNNSPQLVQVNDDSSNIPISVGLSPPQVTPPTEPEQVALMAPDAGGNTPVTGGGDTPVAGGGDTPVTGGGDTPVTGGGDTPVAGGGDTPVAGGGDTPVTGGGDTPVAGGGDTPVTGGGDTPVTGGGDTPVTGGGDTPVTGGGDTPVTGGGDTPVTGGGDTPVTGGGDTPVTGGGDTPVAGGGDTPVTGGGDTPVAGGGDTPVTGGGDTPVAGGGDTPVAGGGDTPVAGGGDTPVTGGGDTPVAGGGDTPVAGGGDTPVTGGGDTLVAGGGDTPVTGGGDTPVTGGGDTPGAGGGDTPVTGGGDTPVAGGGDTPVTGGGDTLVTGGEPISTVDETDNDELLALNDDLKDDFNEEDENNISLSYSDEIDLDDDEVKCAFNDGRGSAQELDLGSSNPVLGTPQRLQPMPESDPVFCSEEGDLEAS